MSHEESRGGSGGSGIVIVIVAVLACVLLLGGCGVVGVAFMLKPSRRGLPNGTTQIRGDDRSYSVHYAREAGGGLAYAFVVDDALTLLSTNDPAVIPGPSGVHWLRNSREGLWVNGSRVVMPETSRVFVIRKDGTIRPVHCTEEQLRAIRPGGGISDGAFVEKVLRPALGR